MRKKARKNRAFLFHALRLSLLIRAEQARIAELVKDYLTKVGIRSEIRSLDLSAWVVAKDKYDYDLTVARTTPWGMLMHAGWGTGYFDSRRTGQGVLHVLEDPAFLGLADRILAETEPARREAFAPQIQEYYARELPGIALYWNMVVTPYNKAFRGWQPDPLYGIYNIETLTAVSRASD
jgi:peptide/nickel transport system substrate-binding protein